MKWMYDLKDREAQEDREDLMREIKALIGESLITVKSGKDKGKYRNPRMDEMIFMRYRLKDYCARDIANVIIDVILDARNNHMSFERMKRNAKEE